MLTIMLWNYTKGSCHAEINQLLIWRYTLDEFVIDKRACTTLEKGTKTTEIKNDFKNHFGDKETTKQNKTK